MLVSVEELRRYMGGYEPAPGLEIEMVNILTGVQYQLETWLNRPVELVQVRESSRSDGYGNVYLSVTPVRKILSLGLVANEVNIPEPIIEPYVSEADPLIGDDGRTIDKIYNGLSLPTIRPGGFWVPYYNTNHYIEYVAGLDGSKLENIKLAIKRVAAREYAANFVDTAGLRTGRVEDTEVGDNRAAGWTANELNSLQRYRRRIAI
jgi:hypothetical protein